MEPFKVAKATPHTCVDLLLRRLLCHKKRRVLFQVASARLWFTNADRDMRLQDFGTPLLQRHLTRD
jgi:hypothetical protein